MLWIMLFKPVERTEMFSLFQTLSFPIAPSLSKIKAPIMGKKGFYCLKLEESSTRNSLFCSTFEYHHALKQCFPAVFALGTRFNIGH